uniref:Uncharacterized protein n=1 Tax=Aquisalinus luteolus TaxID=1566827 RepID=A0A8J3AAH8_9PROT|nr:hypothetical protein GCM10011355_30360 [Aquisalinus luteolus]
MGEVIEEFELVVVQHLPMPDERFKVLPTEERAFFNNACAFIHIVFAHDLVADSGPTVLAALRLALVAPVFLENIAAALLPFHRIACPFSVVGIANKICANANDVCGTRRFFRVMVHGGSFTLEAP